MIDVWGDFSGKPPGVKSLRRAGVLGVIRYTGLGSEGKQIQSAEANEYHDNDYPYGLVAELGTNDAWATADDYRAGRLRAEIALEDMIKTGAVHAKFLSCAADAHASSSNQINDAIAYAAGFCDVVNPVLPGAFYGFSETSRAVHKSVQACKVHWRCGSQPAGDDLSWLNFWQRNINTQAGPARININGTDVDLNEVINLPQTVKKTKKLTENDMPNGTWPKGEPEGTFHRISCESGPINSELYQRAYFGMSTGGPNAKTVGHIWFMGTSNGAPLYLKDFDFVLEQDADQTWQLPNNTDAISVQIKSSEHETAWRLSYVPK